MTKWEESDQNVTEDLTWGYRMPKIAYIQY